MYTITTLIGLFVGSILLLAGTVATIVQLHEVWLLAVGCLALIGLGLSVQHAAVSWYSRRLSNTRYVIVMLVYGTLILTGVVLAMAGYYAINVWLSGGTGSRVSIGFNSFDMLLGGYFAYSFSLFVYTLYRTEGNPPWRERWREVQAKSMRNN